MQFLKMPKDFDALHKIVNLWGFTDFSYIHINPYKIPIFFSTYQKQWIRKYCTRDYVSSDWVITQGKQSILPFTWGELLPKTPSTEQQRVIKDAQEFQIMSGVSVPIYNPLEGLTLLTLTTDQSQKWVNRTVSNIQADIFLLTYLVKTFLQDTQSISDKKSKVFSQFYKKNVEKLTNQQRAKNLIALTQFSLNSLPPSLRSDADFFLEQLYHLMEKPF